jgi:hypothetical protein
LNKCFAVTFIANCDFPTFENSENRIKELKADFGLESFNLRDFWATEAALTATMLAYNLMSLFRQSTMRTSVQPTMATLRHQVFAAPAWSGDENGPRANQYTVYRGNAASAARMVLGAVECGA